MAGAGEGPDKAVLLLSDKSLPCLLKVTLDKEQKKYISLGDLVSVKLEGKNSKLEGRIDYLAESKNASEKYEAVINLPENTGTPGESGTVFKCETGEKYRICLPLEALHTENDNWAAIKEGALEKDSQVILSSTKELKRGDTVIGAL